MRGLARIHSCLWLIVLGYLIGAEIPPLECASVSTSVSCGSLTSDLFLRLTFLCDSRCTVFLQPSCWQQITGNYDSQQQCLASAESSVVPLLVWSAFILSSFPLWASFVRGGIQRWEVPLLVASFTAVIGTFMTLTYTFQSYPSIGVGSSLPCVSQKTGLCRCDFVSDELSRLTSAIDAVRAIQTRWRVPLEIALGSISASVAAVYWVIYIVFVFRPCFGSTLFIFANR
jgi:hypothetical protein